MSRSGSIDWLCAPRFDSDACFTALVGYDEHGRWSLFPTATVRENRQHYRGDTMILETEFACDGGVARVIDFMPMSGRCDVVRIIEGVEGEVPLEMLLDVRFGYGADTPFIEKTGDGVCFRVRTGCPHTAHAHGSGAVGQARIRLLPGEERRSHPDSTHLVRLARRAACRG